MSPQITPKRDQEAAAVLLEKAARRITDNHWTRHGLARNGRGRRCASTADEAVRWSLLGAFHVELERRGYGQHKEDRVYRLAVDALEAARPGWRVWHGQEGRKAREAAALAVKASKRLRKEQKP